jgi:hypothetical protein
MTLVMLAFSFIRANHRAIHRARSTRMMAGWT